MNQELQTSIALNARNLHADAQRLADAGSHQRSASLSILAIEEVGKYLLYKWFTGTGGQQFRRSWLTHKRKQFAAFAIVYWHVQQQAMIGVAKTLAPHDWPRVEADTDWGKTQIFISEAFEVSQKHSLERVRNGAVQALNLVSAMVTTSIRNHPIACLGGLARKGEIDKIKQAGFYIDPPDEEDSSDAREYGERQARFWLELAGVVLGALESNELCLELADHFAKQHHVVPPPSTELSEWTAKQWRDYLQGRMKTGPLEREKIFERKPKATA